MAEAVSIFRAIEQGRLDAKGVPEHLDTLDVDRLVELLGEPRKVAMFAEGYGRHWKQGDGRPLLADEDPAVQQAIALCAAARVRGEGLPALGAQIHPASCSWCDYDVTLLLEACEWATFASRYLVSELLVWDGVERSSYLRATGVSGYQNPEHLRFWSQSAHMRAHRIAVAAGNAAPAPVLVGGEA